MSQSEDQLEYPVPPNAAVVFGDNLERAVRYWELLKDVATVRGLIGPREVPRLWDRHVLNCAVIGEAIDQGAAVVDIGSGAGLPGIPLAIARPDVKVALVEPLLRRTTFLTEVVDELGLENVTVVRGRAEEKAVRKQVGGADVVTSRAVAPLGKLMGWSLPLAKVGGAVMAMKGSSAAEEIERDAQAISKAGGGASEIRIVGSEVLAEPTTLVVTPRVR